MKCSIVTIGDEILAGKTVDSNSTWLSKRMNGLGIDTAMTFTVPDDIEKMSSIIRQALSTADIVITTGGLGPTDDDLTRAAIAKVAGVELLFDSDYFDKIRRIFTDRGLCIPENTRREAYVPRGAEILENGVGVAPGLLLELDNKYLIALPGVPPELKDIFDNQLLLRFRSFEGIHTKRVEVFYTTGIPESILFDKLTDTLGELGTSGIGSYPGNLGVELRFTIDPMDERADRKLEIIEKTLKPWCYSRDQESLPAVIGGLLRGRQQTLATAESCTGGLLSSRIVDISGASDWFEGGAVTYSNRSKAHILRVSEGDLEEYGAVSPLVAAQMAQGAAEIYHSDYALSTTGIAGPTGGSPEKPVGIVYYALKTPERTLVRKNRFTRGREDHRYRTSQAALAMLWLELEGKYDNHQWEDGSEGIDYG